MNIGIIGAGSIGLLFSSILSKYHKITLYTRTSEQSEQLNNVGIVFEQEGVRRIIKIHAENVSNIHNGHDLFIIAVKQYHIKQLIPSLQKLNSKIPLLFLQNGMGHLNHLEDLSNETILLGVVEHGALKESLTSVRHTGKGLTKIAKYKDLANKLDQVIHALHQENFPVIKSYHYKDMLISKLVINAVINPLTALLNVQNGELVTNPYYFKLVHSVFHEICLVLEISGEKRNQYFQSIVQVCERTSANISSMLKDVRLNRETEIEGIVGYLINEAKRNNTSVYHLQFLYHSIKGKKIQRGSESCSH